MLDIQSDRHACICFLGYRLCLTTRLPILCNAMPKPRRFPAAKQVLQVSKTRLIEHAIKRSSKAEAHPVPSEQTRQLPFSNFPYPVNRSRPSLGARKPPLLKQLLHPVLRRPARLALDPLQQVKHTAPHALDLPPHLGALTPIPRCALVAEA